MSVSKSGSGPSRSGKVSLKERDFREPVSKQKMVAVQKSASNVKKPDLAVKPGSLCEEFIRALRVSDRAEHTIRSYCDAVKMFQAFIKKSPLNVTVNDIRAFFFIF